MSLTWSMLEQLTSGGFDHLVDGIVGVLNSGSTKGGTAQDVTNVVGAVGAAGGMAGVVASAAGAGAGAAGAAGADAGMAPPASANLIEGIEEQMRQRAGVPTGPARRPPDLAGDAEREAIKRAGVPTGPSRPYGPPDPAGDAEREAIKRAGAPTGPAKPARPYGPPRPPDLAGDAEREAIKRAGRPEPRVGPKYYSPEDLEQMEKQKRYDQYKRQHLPADRLWDDWQSPGTPKNKVGFSESDIREARKVAEHLGEDPETYLPNGGGLPGGPAMSWAAGKILGPVLGDYTELSMRAANASGLVQDLTPPVENWNPDPDGWDPTGGGGFTGPDGTSGYDPGPGASGGDGTQQAPQYPGYPGYPPGYAP